MMRLIDADEAKKSLFSCYSFVNENTSKSNYAGETLMAYEVADMIEDCMDNTPTIDFETLPIVKELQEKLEQVTVERDAALADLKYIASCECCAYGCKNLEADHCFDCGEKECRCRNCLGGDCWEWRGLVAENATAESEVQTNDRP